jgi:predicted NodU family carbamoyl transferase
MGLMPDDRHRRHARNAESVRLLRSQWRVAPYRPHLDQRFDRDSLLAVTLHPSFDFNLDEYKIMGLALHGDLRRFESIFALAIDCRSNGRTRIPILRLNCTRDGRENYLATRQWLETQLIARRDPEAEVTQQHCDVVAALQVRLNRVVEIRMRQLSGKDRTTPARDAGQAGLR